MKLPENLFQCIVNEYKPKVVKGQVEWEPESFTDDASEPLIDSMIPDEILDIPDPGSKMAGYAAQLPSAKASRDYSNTVRSFLDY